MKSYSSLFFLILFGIFAIPLSSIIPLGTILWFNQWITFFTLCCLGIALHIWKRNKILSILIIWCTYSSIVVAHYQTLSTLAQVCLTCLAIEAISKLKRKEVKIILWMIILFSIIQSLMVVLQVNGLDPVFRPIMANQAKFFNTVGFSGSRNQMGLSFAILSPLLVAYCPILIPLAIFCLWTSATISSFFGMIVGCLVVCFFKYKRFFYVCIFILMVSTVVMFLKYENISKDAYMERFKLYKHTIESVEKEQTIMKAKINNQDLYALKKIECNKWFGYGLGMFTKISPRTQYVFLNRKPPNADKHVYSHAHNDLLEFWYEGGRIGLLIALALIFQFFKDFILLPKTKILIISFSCVLAQLVSSMGIFTVHTAIGGMFLAIFYGIYQGEVIKIKERNGKTSKMVQRKTYSRRSGRFLVW